VKADLHEYQEYCIEFVKERPYSALLLQMGLGKTLIVLTALFDLVITGVVTAGKILVIAPLAVARNTWPAEAAKWDHLDFRLSLVLGSAVARKKALEAKADIYVINRENVPWLAGLYKSRWPFETVIIDELSSFKNNQAKRFRALRSVRPYISRLIGLTGTPAPNSLIDLWPQIYLLDQGKRLEKFIGRFREKYFVPAQTDGHVVYKYALRRGAEEQIHRAISDICVSMRAADYLRIPERIDNTVGIDLSEKEMAQYRAFEKQCVLEADGTDITALSAAALAGKLLQMAGGAVYLDAAELKYHTVHERKLERLILAIEEAQGQPVLVFYNYRHEVERIKRALPESVLFTGNQIDAWNSGEISVLLAHPASAGHGLNLQDGGATIVWFGLTWSLELYQQANARLRRQGQKKTVVVHHLVTKGTIDEDVMQAIAKKEAGQDALMEAVRARIAGYRRET